MKYRVRKGIALRDVCGETYLIAAGEAQKYCPLMKQLNQSGAAVWRLMEAGMEEEIIESLLAEFEASEEQVRAGLEKFAETLEIQHYLLRSDEE